MSLLTTGFFCLSSSSLDTSEYTLPSSLSSLLLLLSLAGGSHGNFLFDDASLTLPPRWSFFTVLPRGALIAIPIAVVVIAAARPKRHAAACARFVAPLLLAAACARFVVLGLQPSQQARASSGIETTRGVTSHCLEARLAYLLLDHARLIARFPAPVFGRLVFDCSIIHVLNSPEVEALLLLLLFLTTTFAVFWRRAFVVVTTTARAKRHTPTSIPVVAVILIFDSSQQACPRSTGTSSSIARNDLKACFPDLLLDYAGIAGPPASIFGGFFFNRSIIYVLHRTKVQAFFLLLLLFLSTIAVFLLHSVFVSEADA